jgi:hypothetical protein
MRPGDNKWSCGVFARDLNTDEARWFFQWNPHDLFDWDGINEMVLVDLSINGQMRKTLLHADQMQYADYLAAGLPIGSGVTEAGCKELIKARFCRSGMRWNSDSGAKVLQLRAIRLSDQWDSFWSKVMRYAV